MKFLGKLIMLGISLPLFLSKGLYAEDSWSDYLKDRNCFFTDVNNPISTIKCKSGYIDSSSPDFPKFPMESSHFWDIDIKGNNIEDVSFLKNLKKIMNNFDISDNNIIEVDDLKNVEYIGKSINLSNNPLIDISGLNNLKSAESIYISKTGIVDVDSFKKLRIIKSNLYLNKNRLKNINGLSNLIFIGGNLNLSENSLSDVNGLISLRKASIIDLRGNYNLDNIFGLSNLVDVDYILIDNRIFRKMPKKGSSFCGERLYEKLSISGNGYLKNSYPIVRIAMAFCNKE